MAQSTGFRCTRPEDGASLSSRSDPVSRLGARPGRWGIVETFNRRTINPSMMRCTSNALVPRSPQHCAAAILDPSNLSKWFKGAHSVTTAQGYPEVGGTISFKMGRFQFEERVLENGLPERFVVTVHNAFGDGVVTSRFANEGDGTRYTKDVEFTPRGVLGLLAPLIVPGNVRREVARAVALATNG